MRKERSSNHACCLTSTQLSNYSVKWVVNQIVHIKKRRNFQTHHFQTLFDHLKVHQCLNMLLFLMGDSHYLQKRLLDRKT